MQALHRGVGRSASQSMQGEFGHDQWQESQEDEAGMHRLNTWQDTEAALMKKVECVTFNK
jgi:hypothetical protein